MPRMEAGRVWGAGLLQMRCINTIGRNSIPFSSLKEEQLAITQGRIDKYKDLKSVGDTFAKTNRNF